ncbi:E3 ubiquitin-protein ligase MYLIP isoform X1 [Oopsacas minuta]|uniref:E3 ubiquitin-protein ligase MYLIP isoform X1 n=1 Tax=Oopsacas minuta TaxID=111878 RepID=A0AAV7KGC3_9METZ|nr:E3 ubiquitin-protein ligase MYLIP isoform X1 [Oopsacas minuta]
MPADTRNSQRLYYVLLPDGEILEIYSRRPDITSGDEIFNEACRRIQLIEIDFFGLKHKEYPTVPERWINLKNILQIEIGSKPTNMSHRAFYRFSLQIKFYAPPYMMLTSKCRYLFYLVEKSKFLDNNFSLSFYEKIEIGSLLARIDCESNLTEADNYSQFIPDRTKIGSRIILASHIAYNHAIDIQLGIESTLRNDSIISFLRKLYYHNEYGRHWYTSLLFGLRDLEIKGSLAIGISEVVITDSAGDEFYKFSLSDITKVQKSVTGEFTIILKDSRESLLYKNISVLSLEQECSTELYRLMAETVCFYLFDKVTPEFRDKLLPTGSNTHIYLYDIKMTICEAFCNYSSQVLDASSSRLNLALKLSDKMPDNSSQPTGNTCNKLQSLRCKICLSSPIEVVFTECGHAACCINCWFCNINSCPICRAPLQWYTAKPIICTLRALQ